MKNKNNIIQSLSVLFLSLFVAGVAHATTLSVTCTAPNVVQPLIDSAVAGVFTTINVSGTCSENLNIPLGKVINIVGQGNNQSTIIQSQNLATDAIFVRGYLNLTNVTISSQAATSFGLVEANEGGEINIGSSVLTSALTKYVIVAQQNSHIKITNSSITALGAGQAAALYAKTNSAIEIAGDPNNYAAGPIGQTTTVTSVTKAALCIIGSSIYLDTQTGSWINLHNAQHGIWGNECSIFIANNGNTRSNITISNNSIAGIYAVNSKAHIYQTTFGNNFLGIGSEGSNLTIYGSNFTNNTVQLKSAFKSGINLNNWSNSVYMNSFSPLNSSSFSCSGDGTIYIASSGTNSNVAPYVGSCVKTY